MSIGEIEFNKSSSVSLRVFNFKSDSLEALFQKIIPGGESDQFSVDPEKSGYHDCEFDGGLVHGFFSSVVPFEVEELVDGIQTKRLCKRIESCEFFALPHRLFVNGKNDPQKILTLSLSLLTGYGVSPLTFEFRHMSQFSERMSSLKNIELTNPRDKEVRRCRLAGKIESYANYNVVDARNHGIKSASGLVDSPLGPITVMARENGCLKITAKRGFIMTIPCLEWVLKMVLEDKPPSKGLM